MQVYGGRRDDGSEWYEHRTVHAPKTAAGRRKAEGVARELYDQIHRRAGEPGTVAEHFERYIDHRRDDWPEGADEETRKMLAKRVVPTLGSIKLDRLTSLDLDTLYTRLRRGGLSPGSIRRTHATLHAALEQAVRWRLIDANPAHAATLPRTTPPAPRKLPRPEILRAAIAEAKPWFAAFIRLATNTGARTSELTGLRWEDVDLEDSVLRIWQSKTRNWKALALGERTTGVLADHRQRVATLYESLSGKAMPADWWVFTSPRRPDQPLTASRVGHQWESLRDKVHGLEGVPFKILRKTMSTVLFTSGFDTKTVMYRGGWSAGHIDPRAAVLLTHYAQAVPEQDRRAAETLDDWLES